MKKEVNNMPKNFAILEVGSTNTKCYIYKNNKLNNYGQKHIAFKDNYVTNKTLLESDIQTLYDYITEIKKETDTIYAFGTSIFRKLTQEELTLFTNNIETNLNINFKVVTADEESLYTVKGVINNIDYNKKMAVVIGGGGSTELAIIDNKKIIKEINLDFGAMDITASFPDLKEDITTTKFNTILNHTLNLIPEIDDNVEALVLAGGDYIYFYENANYEMEENFLYQDNNQTYLLTIEKANEYDKDILNKSLYEIKSRCAGNENWWDGARGMRFCMNAVAKKLNAKYIIPTRINMIIGLTNEILENADK